MNAEQLSNAVAALGIDQQMVNSFGWTTVDCPSCTVVKGHKPALRVNVQTGAFKCYRCGADSKSSSLADFVRNPMSPTLAAVDADTSTPPLSDAMVDKYHAFLMNSPGVINDVGAVRGWTADTLTALRIGFDGQHLWIPIVDATTGDLVNVRLYDPFRRARVKSKHYSDSATKKTAVWCPSGVDKLGDIVFWFEGEPDGILADQMSLPTALVTGGSGTWINDILEVAKGRTNFLLYDMDSKGRKGSVSVAARMRAAGIKVHNLEFELSSSEYNDFSDAVLKDGRDREYFMGLAKAALEGNAPPPPPVSVSVKLGSGVPGDPIKVKAHVTSVSESVKLLPRTVDFSCRMSWRPEGACRGCPMNAAGGSMRFEVDPESEMLLQLAEARRSSHRGLFADANNIPLRCPQFSLTEGSWWQSQEVILSPPLSDRAGGDSTVRPAVFSTPSDGRMPPIRANQVFNFTGIVRPNPVTNSWTLVSNTAIAAGDDFRSFEVNEEVGAKLAETFRPKDWTLPEVRASFEREEDRMARHITHIYGRRLIHRALDLMYHSVVSVPFDGMNRRGWLQVLAIGDSRVGKSQVCERMRSAFAMGEMVMDSSNTTFAGLVGGLQQVGGSKSWNISWGMIPINDGGACIVDEISSMPTRDIGRMSGMRSSGIAEITKIRKSSTPARTRLFMGGNPRGEGKALSSYPTPVEAVIELIGAREDLARFDIVLAMKEGLVGSEESKKLGDQPLPIDQMIRRDLIKYAWSRNQDEVQWEEGVEKVCEAVAAQMVGEYSSKVPIVEPGEHAQRLARVAAAVAARTFSTTDDYTTVIIRECHVAFAQETLRACYDGDLSYNEFSEYERKKDLDTKKAVEKIASVSANVAETCRGLLRMRAINAFTVELALGLERTEATTFLSDLFRYGAAEFAEGRANQSLQWTDQFITLLRKTERNPPEVATASMF